jgi:hypothetical protein
MVALASTGAFVALVGAVLHLVVWIGALVNTFALADKAWFVVLLIGGLIGFVGVVFAPFVVMIGYLIAGPDGVQPAPETKLPASPGAAIRRTGAGTEAAGHQVAPTVQRLSAEPAPTLSGAWREALRERSCMASVTESHRPGQVDGIGRSVEPGQADRDFNDSPGAFSRALRGTALSLPLTLPSGMSHVAVETNAMSSEKQIMSVTENTESSSMVARPTLHVDLMTTTSAGWSLRLIAAAGQCGACRRLEALNPRRRSAELSSDRCLHRRPGHFRRSPPTKGAATARAGHECRTSRRTADDRPSTASSPGLRSSSRRATRLCRAGGGRCRLS